MGNTRDQVGKVGLFLASGVFRTAFYVCVALLIFWLGKSAYQFGYDVFNQQAVSPGAGQEVTVVIPDGASTYDVAKILKSKGLIQDSLVFFTQEKLSTYKGQMKAGTYLLSTAYTPTRIMGILAGDALLNYAFETACRAFEEESEHALRIGKALKILADKAGIYGMIGGQVVDVQESGKAVSGEVLDFIYRLKTSALIEASMMAGAVLAGAEEGQVSRMEQIAGKTGLAFQIQDDILDVTSTTELLGKPVHSDEKNEKTTYVTWKGIEKAHEDVERLTQEAVDLLRKFPAKDDFLEELLKSLVYREK